MCGEIKVLSRRIITTDVWIKEGEVNNFIKNLVHVEHYISKVPREIKVDFTNFL